VNNVIVVDTDAEGLAQALNRVAKHEGHPVEYQAAATPDLLFARMDSAIPQLVLLHHTWSGLPVADLISRIQIKSADTRVLVFTGRELDLREVIECVRLGVCDYWKKAGSFDELVWSRRISSYCASEVYTLRALAQPSGSVLGLLKKAEADSGHLRQLTSQVESLQRSLDEARSEDGRQMRGALSRGVEFLAVFIFLTIAFVTLAQVVSHRVAALVVVSFQVSFLFFQGRIAEALVEWRGGRVKLGG
jgi:DNA-binding NtrC family response regulator